MWITLAGLDYGLIVNTGTSDITLADLRNATFSVTASRPEVVLIPFINIGNEQVIGAIHPGEAMGSIFPSSGGFTGNEMLLPLIQPGETLRDLAGMQFMAYGVDRDFNTYQGPIQWHVTMLMAGYEAQFTISADVHLGPHKIVFLTATRVTAQPTLPMTVSLDPQTLNLQSLGHWVTAYLEAPPPFTASQIDLSSIRLNGSVSVDSSAPTAIGDHDGNGIPDLMAKFDRGEVELTLSEGTAIPATVTGTADGHRFSGTDTISVVRGPVSAPAAGGTVLAGAPTQVEWQTPSGVDIPSVALLSSLDGGANWTLIGRDLPNTGSYEWTAPVVDTRRARLAVVLVESSAQAGYLVDGVISMSSMFSISRVTGVGTDTRLGFALRRVAPNPARQTMHVTFSLPDARSAKLGLYDVSGRRVLEREVGSLGPGVRTVTLDGPAILPAGIYVIRLTQAGRSLTTRVALIR